MAEFIACQVCDENHIAIYRCVDCGDNICEIIAKSHQRMKGTRDHKLVPLVSDNEGNTTQIDEEWQSLVKKVICPVHNDEFKYFDESCGCVICRDCFALTHHGHKCVSIKEAAIGCKGRLDGKCQEVKFQADLIKQGEKKALDTKAALDKEYEKIHGEIGDVFDKLMTAMCRRRDGLYMELDNLFRNKSELLVKQVETLREKYKRLESMLEEAEKALGKLEGTERDCASSGKDERKMKMLEYQYTNFVMSFGSIMGELEKPHESKVASLEPATKEKMKLTGCEKEVIDDIVKRVDGLGGLVDGHGSGEHSKGEGAGLVKCVFDEKKCGEVEYLNKFKVTSFSSKDKRNTLGGDKVQLRVESVVLAALGNDVVNENPVRYRVKDLGGGEYEVEYQLMCALKGEVMDLVVELNGEKLEGKVWKVPIEKRLEISQFVLGQFMRLSMSDTVAAVVATESSGWCKLNSSLNEIKNLKLRLTSGSSGFWKICIYDSESPSFAPGSGPSGSGEYYWAPGEGTFSYNGSMQKSGATKLPPNGSTCIANFMLSETGIAVHIDGSHAHTFTNNFSPTKKYFMYIASYYGGTKVEILP